MDKIGIKFVYLRCEGCNDVAAERHKEVNNQ